jgi:putative pyruvate formate lyase activating enzyme
MKLYIEQLFKKLESCNLCPNNCNVNRLKGEKGVCKLGENLMVSAVQLHFGEEKELIGTGGSGTIFFSGCNMKCVFCQNYEISWEMKGELVTETELADHMITLQEKEASNINLVSPTPQVPMIFLAIEIAKNKGLKLPIVYNSGGYDSVEVLRLLNGLVDIYMPDFKYGDSENGLKYSGVENYFDAAKAAIKEMYNQTGDLVVDKTGKAIKGLIVRHLVLPNNSSGSKKILDFIAHEVSKDTYVNIMRQYHPAYRASNFSALSNHNISQEYYEAIKYAESIGLTRGFR